MSREANRLNRMATVAAKASSSVPPKTTPAFAMADNGASSKAYCSHTSGALEWAPRAGQASCCGFDRRPQWARRAGEGTIKGRESVVGQHVEDRVSRFRQL